MNDGREQMAGRSRKRNKSELHDLAIVFRDFELYMTVLSLVLSTNTFNVRVFPSESITMSLPML